MHKRYNSRLVIVEYQENRFPMNYKIMVINEHSILIEICIKCDVKQNINKTKGKV